MVSFTVWLSSVQSFSHHITTPITPQSGASKSTWPITSFHVDPNLFSVFWTCLGGDCEQIKIGSTFWIGTQNIFTRTLAVEVNSIFEGSLSSVVRGPHKFMFYQFLVAAKSSLCLSLYLTESIVIELQNPTLPCPEITCSIQKSFVSLPVCPDGLYNFIAHHVCRADHPPGWTHLFIFPLTRSSWQSCMPPKLSLFPAFSRRCLLTSLTMCDFWNISQGCFCCCWCFIVFFSLFLFVLLLFCSFCRFLV